MNIKLILDIDVEETDDINSDAWFIYDRILEHIRSGNVIPSDMLVDDYDIKLEVKG